jgi:hypothetical protein
VQGEDGIMAGQEKLVAICPRHVFHLRISLPLILFEDEWESGKGSLNWFRGKCTRP